MALPLAYFFLCLLFFLPNFYFSCPNSLTCGVVEIHSPFFLNAKDHPSSTDTTPGTCAGKYSIRCDDDSGPMIKFNDHEYPVIDIIYPEKVLILQDLALGNYLLQGKCGFLYKFTDPIPNFHVPPRSPVLIPPNSSVDCQRDTHAFSRAFFPELNGSNHCNDYKLYYWEELEDHHAPASKNCLVTQPTLLEWKLSFGGGDGSLSLLSVGFSRTFELHEDCFYCQTPGQSCTGNNRAANSSCSCENICKHKGSWSKKKTIGIVAGAGGALILGCSVGLFLYMNRRKRRRQSILLSQSITSEISLKNNTELVDTTYHTHIFSYGELEEATDSFNESRKLGDGGFGTVYKGELKDGRTVAVKRLFEKNYRRLEQFMNEIEILSCFRHPNLVALYGCTSRHSRELLLVYEFISNGTLADHLHGPLASKGAISWPIRISIAIQTADALAYLHSVEPQIIHRDVKTSNILLDKNFHVKVADFGLSRLFPLDVTHVSTAPQGTPGYVDPEYHQCYRLTDRSDVYSFGVVLIELISSKPAVDISRNHHEINLANMAITKIQNRQIDQLVDFELGYQSDLAINRMIDQVAEIAFQCLQSERDMRPSIRAVFEILKKIEGGRVQC